MGRFGAARSRWSLLAAGHCDRPAVDRAPNAGLRHFCVAEAGSFTPMDENGFLPPQPCRRCGRQLEGEGSGRPAELYAGTFTGLCNGCTNAPDYSMSDPGDPKANIVSCSPALPSWRRDRETFVAFADCPYCLGHGYAWRSGSTHRWRQQCDVCADRRWNRYARAREHWYRKRFEEIRKAARKVKDDPACRVWRDHPLAREWRRLMRAWWGATARQSSALSESSGSHFQTSPAIS